MTDESAGGAPTFDGFGTSQAAGEPETGSPAEALTTSVTGCRMP